ncbi:MAG: hypothetical protein AAGF11_51960 [Myxococcota bacterium]
MRERTRGHATQHGVDQGGDSSPSPDSPAPLGSDIRPSGVAGARPEGQSLVYALTRNRVFEAMFPEPVESPRLGRYVLLSTIGRVGMGIVFEAFDPILDRRVALKVLHQTERTQTQ